jgi:hypothetical protein
MGNRRFVYRVRFHGNLWLDFVAQQTQNQLIKNLSEILSQSAHKIVQ